jgi:hypothetical protein
MGMLVIIKTGEFSGYKKINGMELNTDQQPI